MLLKAGTYPCSWRIVHNYFETPDLPLVTNAEANTIVKVYKWQKYCQVNFQKLLNVIFLCFGGARVGGSH